MRKCKNTTIIIKNEIDYDKIKQIVKESINEEINICRNEDSQKDVINDLQSVICAAILEAKQKEDEKTISKKEDASKEIIRKRQEAFGVEKYFEEDGTPKNKIAKLVLIGKFITCKESKLKDITLLRDVVNGVVSIVFLLAEWFLYLLAIGFILCGIVKPICQCINTEVTLISIFPQIITSFLYALVSFIISRLMIRILKIECKYSKDNNYMLNFLAVIVAVIAIVVSVIER